MIAGPTATGKSDVAACLCSSEKGIIVSADSVQTYKGVQIGANKPTDEERKETPHILVDVADTTENYNAAEWRDDAISAIRALLAQSDNVENPVVEASVKNGRRSKGYSQDEKLLPVVCGGSMMYLQWLVHGAPDAVRPSPVALEKAQSIISTFQETNNFKGAVEHVSSYGQIFSERIDTFSGEDWYRLRRTLEVALTAEGEDDKEGMIEKLYTGERKGSLESMGYDVRCFFLCPDDRMSHTKVIDERCEQMIMKGLIQETTELTLSGNMPEMAARAIGYRQTLDYLNDTSDHANDQEGFNSYIDEFTTATRRYAKKQMQWFRKEKDFVFVPVSLSLDKADRVNDAANRIQRYCQLSRQEFEKELFADDGESAIAKVKNQEQGKGMKFYRFERHILKPGATEYSECFSQALECRKRMQQQNKKPRIEE